MPVHFLESRIPSQTGLRKSQESGFSFVAFIFSLILISLFLILTPKAFAQTTATQPPPPTTYQALPEYVSPQSPTYSNLMIFNFMHGVSCIAVGQSPIGPCVEYQMQKDIQGKMQTVPVLSSINTSGGLLGSIGSVLTAMYTYKPINSGEFFIGLGKDMGIVSEAHAQVGGSGSGVLSPIFKLWETSRNFAYLILIVIFLVIGVMVMLRNKVNPQTVITVQAALPGLVIGLLLITFSYFLAALITDLAFLGMDLVGYYFSVALDIPGKSILTDLSGQNIIKIFSKFIGVISEDDIRQLLAVIFDNSPGNVQAFMRFAAGLMAFQAGSAVGHVIPKVGDLVAIALGIFTSLSTAAFPTQIIGQVLGWVAIIVMIYTMIKLLFRLINNYLSIVFLTITAPFQFLAASLPGRQGIATDWMRNMLCNVLAFPAVFAVLYFVAYILNFNADPFIIPGGTDASHGFFQFRDLGNKQIFTSALPLFGGLDARIINILMAFSALIVLPKIPDIICQAVGKVGQSGQLLGQELGGNIRGGQGYANQGQQLGQMQGKIGQDYNTFRGVEPGHSPASGVNIGKTNLGDWTPFYRSGATKGWRTWKPFGKKSNI